MKLGQHLAIIDPSTNYLEIDCYNTISRISGIPCTYHAPSFYGFDSLLQSGQCKGAVILGAACSVNDEVQWQNKLKTWLDKQWEANPMFPLLGICYGHQLIAEIFGGEVGFCHSNQHKHLGVRSVEVDLPGVNRLTSLIVSHNEEVKVLPKNFSVIAKSESIAIDGMRHVSRPIFGFQPHIEAGPGFVKNQKIDPKNTEYSNDGFEILNSILEQMLV